MADTPGRVAATLTAIRERCETASKIMVSWKAQIQRARASAADVPALLAAVEAAGRLPGNWERETARLDALAESTADPHSRAAISMRAQAFEECARLLREAIGTALTGTQPSEDESDRD